MLGAGVIDWRRARAIEAGTCHLSTAAAQDVVDRIAQAAPSMTTGQIAARVRKLCMETHPEEAKERYERAIATRRLVTRPMVDGTANLQGLDLAPDRVAGVARRINGIAKSLRGGSEKRTMDQIRADVFLDLIEGQHRDANDASVVHINVDLGTLAGLTERASEVAGTAPSSPTSPARSRMCTREGSGDGASTALRTTNTSAEVRLEDVQMHHSEGTSNHGTATASSPVAACLLSIVTSITRPHGQRVGRPAHATTLSYVATTTASRTTAGPTCGSTMGCTSGPALSATRTPHGAPHHDRHGSHFCDGPLEL